MEHPLKIKVEKSNGSAGIPTARTVESRKLIDEAGHTNIQTYTDRRINKAKTSPKNRDFLPCIV